MPVGPPIIPGSYVNVTADPGGNIYPLIQAPTATMPVASADVQALTQAVINIQEALSQFFGIVTTVSDGDDAYSQSTSSVTFVGPTGSALLVPDCHVDDILVVSISVGLHLGPFGSASVAEARCLVRDNYPTGADNAIPGTVYQVPATEAAATQIVRHPYAMTFQWSVVAAGSTRVGFQGRVVNGTDTLTFGTNKLITVQQFRKPGN